MKMEWIGKTESIILLEIWCIQWKNRYKQKGIEGISDL